VTTRLYLRRPTAFGGDHVELTDFYGVRRGTPFMDGDRSLVELGMRCAEGSASQGTFLWVDPFHRGDTLDPVWSTSFPLAHSLVTWTEDAPGYEAWLFRGRVANDEGGRGEAVQDMETEWNITVDDANVDLRGQAFTDAWVRPEETDVARLVALQAYILNGASSTAPKFRSTCQVTVSTSHLTPNTNTVTMPAKKYVAGSQPQDVVQDCSETAGKNYAVVIHHTGGSHLCLFYTVPGDNTTYVSPITISDRLEDWDPDHPTNPVLEPHWEKGDATIFQMQQMLSGMVGVWGSSETATFVEDTAVRDNYEYWVEGYHTGTQTAAESDDKTAGVFFQRKQLQVTHRASVILNADQVDMVGAGMSLQMRTAATHDPDIETFITRRIVECRFEPRNDGRYWCHMDIERPILLNRNGPGYTNPIPPVSTIPPGAPIVDFEWTFDANEKDVTNLYPVGTLATNWHAGYVHTHVLNPGVGNRTAGTKPAITPGSFTFTATYGRNPGTPYNPGGVNVKVYSVNTGVDTLIGTTATTTGTVTDSISVTVPAGGDHITFELPYNSSTLYGVTISHGTASLGFTGTALPGAPGSAGAAGSLGSSPIYMPIDTVLPAQIADDTPIGDEGGYFEGATVEEALQELGASAGDSPADHDLPHGYDLTKQGIQIERGSTGTWKEALVESPNVFWDPAGGHYKMVFVGYSGTPAAPTEGALGYATADSPDGPWTEYGSNPFFSKSGAGTDSAGCSGPLVWYEDGTYHLYYIGLTASGYEQGTKTLNYAHSTDFSSWTREGAIISPSGSGWRNTAIWHPNIVKRGGLYYLFFNATGSVTERIGYATSPDLATWTVDDVNSPVLSEGAGGQWDDVHVGDPSVYRIGETWYMAYYAYDGATSRDGIAFTSDADFPLGWTKYSGNPILSEGAAGSYDENSAHKPAIWLTSTRLYHWYTAVSESFLKREIGLATQDAPVPAPSSADLQDAGHWETIVSGSSPPVAVTNEASTDWLVGWVPPS
jgi:predicted GH43/DUF377 family glycosyl hydrolase